jgi:hypothetical protein
MSDGVAAGTPLTFFRNWTSALASIAAIGLDLPIRGHGELASKLDSLSNRALLVNNLLDICHAWRSGMITAVISASSVIRARTFFSNNQPAPLGTIRPNVFKMPRIGSAITAMFGSFDPTASDTFGNGCVFNQRTRVAALGSIPLFFYHAASSPQR